MRECLRRKICAEGSEAPKTLKDAQEFLFGIKDGVLANVSTGRRSELAENIIVIATGEKSNPCYSIIDKGEGQTPRKMPDTFLSLIKSNKSRIPFVQGKFNMGGTGSLQFCGKDNIQLIITRRDPEIVINEEDDESSDYWGFTVIRREYPSGGMRSSTFKYLAPEGKILTFRAESLPLLPGEYPIAHEKFLKWGTFIKLYEYQLIGLKAAVYFDLYYRLSVLLPNIALPIILCERRSGYRSHSYSIILSGLSVRLDEDKFENIEPGFPDSSTINIERQAMKIQIYVFKREKKRHYSRDEGVIFTINGQSHGFIPKSFFARKDVGMSYLADSILLIADCSSFDRRTQEDLFMNSRDRLRDGDLKNEIEEKLEYIVKNHQGLRELRERRRREEIEGRISDAKPLVEVIEKAIKNSPTLSKLFSKGLKITNPFDVREVGTKQEYRGKRFPTCFILRGNFTRESPKSCPVNHRFRVQFETDAENDYFTRDTDPGEFKLSLGDGTPISDFTGNLWNGIYNLTVELPTNVTVGDFIIFMVEVNDVSRLDPFSIVFFIRVDPAKEETSGEKGKRTRPPGPDDGERRKEPEALDLPNIREVHKDEWEKFTPHFDRETALKIKDSGEGSYDFFINLDNVYLLTEMKGRASVEPQILESQYKYGMVLLGLSLLRAFEEDKKQESIYDDIEKITKAISPMLLPMIATLGELEE